MCLGKGVNVGTKSSGNELRTYDMDPEGLGSDLVSTHKMAPVHTSPAEIMFRVQTTAWHDRQPDEIPFLGFSRVSGLENSWCWSRNRFLRQG